MSLVDEFISVFGVWPEAHPYIWMMVDEKEMELVVAIEDQAVTITEVAERLGLTSDQASAFLERCYSRCIVNKTVENSVTVYTPTNFGERLDHF